VIAVECWVNLLSWKGELNPIPVAPFIERQLKKKVKNITTTLCLLEDDGSSSNVIFEFSAPAKNGLCIIEQLKQLYAAIKGAIASSENVTVLKASGNWFDV
tara:strand:- start:1829 stop:2131 length:303 start_codon:yes stop_codon:yes gene_type:complete